MDKHKPTAEEKAWFKKWAPIGKALKVGQRVMSRHDQWLGTVTEKYPHGGGAIVYDNLSKGGGGPAAFGAFNEPTGETVPRLVVKQIVEARERWSMARGFCKADTAVTRVLAAYFKSLGRDERKPEGHRAWPIARTAKRTQRRPEEGSTSHE